MASPRHPADLVLERVLEAMVSVEFHDVSVIATSDEALLCDIEGEEIWIPISQITDDSEVYKSGTSGTLIITDWLAAKKGLV